MRTEFPAHLSDRDREAVAALAARLPSAYPATILHLILFGSKARDDARSDSDIDVLVVTQEEGWPVQHALLTLGARLSLEYDVLLNLFVVSQEKWSWMERVGHPLYRNVAAEGIALAAPARAASPSIHNKRHHACDV